MDGRLGRFRSRRPTPYQRSQHHAQPRFRIPPSQELSDYLDNELLKAIKGQTTPRAALDRTAGRWREILSQTGYLRE